MVLIERVGVSIIGIGELSRKYDRMKMPAFDTREGKLSAEEVETFIQALRKLRESIG